MNPLVGVGLAMLAARVLGGGREIIDIGVPATAKERSKTLKQRYRWVLLPNESCETLAVQMWMDKVAVVDERGMFVRFGGPGWDWTPGQWCLSTLAFGDDFSTRGRQRFRGDWIDIDSGQAWRANNVQAAIDAALRIAPNPRG